MSNREVQIKQLYEICEDLDFQNKGYIQTEVLAKILTNIPGIRPEITS